MQSQLLASLLSLQSWVETLIEQGKSGNPDLSVFVENNDFKEFERFYKELLPFVNNLAAEIIQLQPLAISYSMNATSLSKQLQRDWFGLLNVALQRSNSSINGLLAVLTEMHANLGNIIYQIKVNDH